MRGFTIAALVAALGGTAAADVTDVARAVFDKQVAALAKGDGAAFAATFGENPTVLLPSTGATMAEDAARIAADVAAWKVTGAKVIKVDTGDLQMNDDYGAWITADLELTVAGKVTAARLTELFTGSETAQTGRALLVTIPADVAALTGAKPTEKPGSEGEVGELLVKPKLAVKDYVGYRDGATVIGWGAADSARGHAGKDLLATWKKLKLVLVGDALSDSGDAWAYAVGRVSMPRGKKKPPVTLDGMVIVMKDVHQEHGELWAPVVVHYGAKP
jgi:hypothetical protein